MVKIRYRHPHKIFGHPDVGLPRPELDRALARAGVQPPTREVPRTLAPTLPAAGAAAKHLADDLRALGPWAQPLADRARQIANAIAEMRVKLDLVRDSDNFGAAADAVDDIVDET